MRGPVHSSWAVAGFLSLLCDLPVDASFTWRGAGEIPGLVPYAECAMDTLVTGFGVHESDFFGSVFFFFFQVC